VTFTLVGANAEAKSSGVGQLAGVTNYLIGNDRRDWVTGVTDYAGVRFDEVYSGIGVHYYDAGGSLEHDFLVAPGADVRQIATRIEGAQGVRLDGGDLVMRLSTGELREHAPLAYQVVGGRRVEVASQFVLRDGGEVGIEVGTYDHGRELVIDPIWNYRTYFGGNNDQEATSLSLASDGTAYVVGNTLATWDPGAGTLTSLGAAAAKTDVFVAQFSPDGSSLVYRTFLLGNKEDKGTGIVVDGDGYAYVTGTTKSTNFPTDKVGNNVVWQATHGNAANNNQDLKDDGFLVKLKADGTGLEWGTYVGGDSDDGLNAVALGTNGNSVFVAGYAGSLQLGVGNNKTTPTRLGNHVWNDDPDALVAQFGSTGDMKFLATLGGKGIQKANGVAVGSDGRPYVTGSATQTLPTTTGAFQSVVRGKADAFVARVTLPTQGGAPSLSYSTLFGGPGNDVGWGIALDGAGRAFITGATSTAASPGFGPGNNLLPATVLGVEVDGTTRAFVARFDSSGTPKPPSDGLPPYFVYVTGRKGAEGFGIARTGLGMLYVAGRTSSNAAGDGFPLVNSLNARYGGGVADAFLAELNPQLTPASSLVLNTYLGGTARDEARAVAVSPGAESAYVAGLTGSANMFSQVPLPIRGFQKTKAGAEDAFLLRLDPNERAAGFLQAIGDRQVLANAPLDFFVSATTGDGSPPIYSLLGAPDGAALDPSTGEFTWTPSASQVGVYTFLVQATDADGLGDSQPLTLTVLPAPGELAGDVLSAAAPVSLFPGVRTTVSASIGDGTQGPNDVDLYRVHLTQGQLLTADVDAQNGDGGPPMSTLDSYLRVFDSAGVELASNGDGTDPDTQTVGPDSILRYQAPTEGDYYVGVSGSPNVTYDPVAGLNVVFTPVGGGGPGGGGPGGSTGPYSLKLTADTDPATTAAVASSSDPSPAGQPVTFTATVSSQGGVPTGDVTFYDGGAVLGSAPLAGGSASLTVSSLSVDDHDVWVNYLGDDFFSGSESDPILQTVY
jgi:hypothetical protein